MSMSYKRHLAINIFFGIKRSIYMCMCISFRPAVGHAEASSAHNGIAELQELHECEEQEAIALVNLPTDNSWKSYNRHLIINIFFGST